MTKTLQVRVDEDLRVEADVVLHEMGLDVPSAVRIFLTKVVNTRSIPFELSAPPQVVAVNPETQVKMDEIGKLWTKKKTGRA